MRLASSAAVVAVLALVSPALAGCSRREPVTPAACTFARVSHGHDGSDPGLAGPARIGKDVEPATSKLFDEAKRELTLMRATSYRHETNVDEESGTFEFDCSGFVSYALRISAPDALAVIPVGIKGRPRAEDYVAYFSALSTTKDPQPWVAVPRAIDVRAGDVIAWTRPDDVDNANTGHMAIVAGTPSPCGASDVAGAIGGSAEWLLRVVDSTQSPHADDDRKKGENTGLGEGTIGIVVDSTGAPIGYRWKGGVSEQAHATKIVIARLR